MKFCWDDLVATQKLKIQLTILLLIFYAYISHMDSWPLIRNFIKLAGSLSAYIDFYNVEKSDFLFEKHKHWFYAHFGRFRNYLVFFFVKEVIRSYLSALENDTEFDLTFADLKATAWAAMGYFLVITAFEDLLSEKVPKLIVDNLKCVVRADRSVIIFVKILSQKRVTSSNLLISLLEDGFCIGLSPTLAQVVIRTLFKGKLFIGKLVTKPIFLLLPSLIQYYLFQSHFTGPSRPQITQELKDKIGTVTLLVFLVIENYGSALTELVERICRRLGVPKNFYHSPADMYETTKAHKEVLSIVELIGGCFNSETYRQKKRLEKKGLTNDIGEGIKSLLASNPAFNIDNTSQVQEISSPNARSE